MLFIILAIYKIVKINYLLLQSQNHTFAFSTSIRQKMLAQVNGYTLHRTILNTLLKSFLPFILKNEQWTRYITQLAKVKNVYIVNQNKITKQNQTAGKCPICEKFIFQDNLFILVLHIEVQHQSPSLNTYFHNQSDQSLVAKKYEFTYDGLEVHLIKARQLMQQNKKEASKKSQKITNNPNQTSCKSYFIEQQGIKFLNSNLKQRNNATLQKIFNKFSKRLQTISSERKFYHSYNVYQTIKPEEQDENSDEEKQEIVERELQRLRIDDFNDVSHWDKILFLEWNSLLRKQKKQLKVIYENQQIVSILEKFCIICKKLQIPKINLNMHLYTLWSVGRIKDFDIIKLLTFYDSYSNEVQVDQIEKK